ncbi:MAG: hypothetical protein COB49_04065 [Alphaproteobacteria bacterium]|nr:MAG: hypothetical protein COB49_04065 [Alphaproteobacteria bacterium]
MQKDLDEEALLDSRFLEKSYQEAMALTQAVASYLEGEHEQIRNHGLTADTEVYYASESMRVSTCLMQVMSWFLVQKGVATGEITKEQAGSSKFRLGAGDICLARVDTSKGNLPKQFIIFLHKAQNLYRQVARMDRMVYGGQDTANPVHEMFNRIQGQDKPE